jgi:hypothetical protein
MPWFFSKRENWPLMRLAPAMVVLAGMLSGASQPARADVIVVQSNAEDLSAGQLIESSAKVMIPAGKQAVFVLPSGATRTVSGPFEGPASSLSTGSQTKSGVFDAVKRYVVTGNTTAGRVGAMRNAMPANFGKPVPFSWRLVPVTATGDVCLLKNAEVALARPQSGAEMTITLLDTRQSRKVRTSFPADASTVPWPRDLDLAPGATYAMLLPGRNPRQIRVRVLSEQPSEEETLLVLHRERCQSQFRAWLRELQQARN